MKRKLITTAFTMCVFTAAAFGDLTIRQTTEGKGLVALGSGTSTTYIKGMKMRIDTDARGTVHSMIFDVANQKLYVFDSKKKNAEVWDMQAFAAEMAKSVETGEVKASVKSNGGKKPIGGKTANGFDLAVTVPAKLGGEEGMPMTVELDGKMWIVKGAPGWQEYAAFYKAAAEKGWIFSDPRAAKGSPGQAKAMAEMYRAMADAGGMPYETVLDISVTGEGPMAAVMARMGGMSMTTTVQTIETNTIDDAIFAPPAGYKLVPKK